MRTTLPVLALLAAPVQAWWDGGHQTTAEIASQLMAADDVRTINGVLGLWNDEFPNTGEVSTAVIWPDLLKCSSTSATYCPSPLKPSLNAMDNWHYINVPLNVDGSDWHGLTTADVDALVKASFDGLALDVMTKALATMKTTQSTWSANFVLRYFLHAFTDIHQPLHTAAGISAALPAGDLGGNKYKFRQPCVATNLHAVWDSAAGEYSTNWTPDMVPGSAARAALSQNASALIAKFANSTDAVDYARWANVSYADFVAGMKIVFPLTIIDSYKAAREYVYTDMSLDLDAKGTVECPSVSYQRRLVQVVERQFYVGGSRLAVVLTQFARQLRSLNLEPRHAC
ncbi:hypothetical protein ACHHYP_16953 [Achlya hypogyna]|uniref:Secreted protein n=1 Tax=Achlya hypogyna TaxID=1202772 RepID=A0A0A7CPU2_ACHHY|nr:secreted protein [Achlya hypogyna]OQR96160.1 hypothetical protein ACHHYP_16953 [Achlya hypogyna]